MSDIIREIEELADRFYSNANAVNSSTKRRRESGNKIVTYIDDALASAKTVYDGVRQVVAADISWSEKNSVILTRCINLMVNSKNQLTLISELQEEGVPHREKFQQIAELIDALSDTLQKMEEYLATIMKREQEIILLDRLIEAKKKYQLQTLKTLQKLSIAVNHDTDIAEMDSGDNIQRGMMLKETVSGIGDLAQAKDIDGLSRILEELEIGIEKAREVNTNSQTQSEFTRQVEMFVREFLAASNEIQQIIQQKHDLFEENLQNVTVLTVAISFELKKFLEAERIMHSMSFENGSKYDYIDLFLLIEIASNDIKYLTDLNLDMTELSHVNNENETRTVEKSNAEQILYAQLQEAVLEMAKITDQPIRLSGENIAIAESIRDGINKVIKDTDRNVADKIEISGGSEAMAKRVMVIDDGAAIRQVVSHVLKAEGYDLLEAVDGQDALNKLDGTKIDLFICDVNMPNMNGIEFLEKIKTDEEFRSYKFAPIIMLTTESGQSMKEKGKQLGAHAWMVKPFQPDQLIAKIKPILGE